MDDSVCYDLVGMSSDSFHVGADFLVHVEFVVDGVNNLVEYIGHVGTDGTS